MKPNSKRHKAEVMWPDQNGVWHMRSYGKRFIFDDNKPGWVIDPNAERQSILAVARKDAKSNNKREF